MPGPIDALRFIHAAITREITALEDRAHGCGSADEVRAIAERVAFLGYVVKGHTDGEEVGLYRTLEERAPHVGAAYLHDHHEEQERFAAFAAVAADADTCGPALLARLRREAVALTEHLTPHIRKENELILPLVCALYDAPEQAGIVGKILSSFSPADFGKVVPWMASRLTQDERATYLGGLARSMPPERFEVIKALVREGTPAADRAALGL